MTSDTTHTAGPDWLDHVAGIEPGDPRHTLRSAHPTIKTHLQTNYDVIFTPTDASHIGVGERLFAAARVAQVHQRNDLAAGYREQLALTDASLGTSATAAPAAIADPRLAAVAAYADLLGAYPAGTDPNRLDELRAAGLDESAIVTLTLVIGFVSYQARALAGLDLLKETS